MTLGIGKFLFAHAQAKKRGGKHAFASPLALPNGASAGDAPFT